MFSSGIPAQLRRQLCAVPREKDVKVWLLSEF
jgi:hypothetical protein